jgi:hypothetical protein
MRDFLAPTHGVGSYNLFRGKKRGFSNQTEDGGIDTVSWGLYEYKAYLGTSSFCRVPKAVNRCNESCFMGAPVAFYYNFGPLEISVIPKFLQRG